jgi:SAM-dependent methyltransferase
MSPQESRSTGKNSYDPATYWDAKARGSGGDPSRAVGMDDPVENKCIDRVQRRLLNRALRLVRRSGGEVGERALDFGCGTGRWTPLLMTSGYQCSGVDISAEMVHIAGKRFPQIDFRHFDGAALPYADECFSLVMSIAVIHHNDYPKQEILLTELVRALQPGGHLILFEGVGPLAKAVAVESPRPVSSWHEALQSRGLTHNATWPARYWILRSLYLDFVSERITRAGLGLKFVPRLALRCDAWLDPYLCRLLPSWYVTRALMVYSKPPTMR